MTGQEARDDERQALISAARISIADADRCVALHITPSTGTLHRRLREVTRALADAHTELAARKHPEPEITAAAQVFDVVWIDDDGEKVEATYPTRPEAGADIKGRTSMLTGTIHFAGWTIRERRLPVGEGEQ